MKQWLLAALLGLIAPSAGADERQDMLQPSGRFSVYGHGAAATPPMGFNPWNAFRTEVDQARIESVVDVIQKRGLQKAGYRYINIDDGWWLKRNADGKIQIRTSMFPIASVGPGVTSFRTWTDMLHARGFKAGLYTDVGRNACSQAFDRTSPNLPVGSVAEREIGLQGFEASDLKTMFQDWGFDYLKVDACGLADFGANSEPVVQASYRTLRPLIVRGDAAHSDRDAVETQYARVGRLLADLNPDNNYVLAICPWGQAGVRDWGGDHGNLWRTSEDIVPTWASMLHNFDSASRRELYAGPGRWNDPDMLTIGLGEFDAKHLTEARTHFSLWAMLSAPLLMGFDLTTAPDALIELLSNPEVIAIDQDPAGNQATLVVDDKPAQVLVKPLSARGERAVLLFNRGGAPVTAQLDPQQMKLAPGSLIQVRDLWEHRDLPASRTALRFALKPHGAVMLRVRGTPIQTHGVLLSEITARIHVAADGLPIYSTDFDHAAGTPRADVSPDGQTLRIAGTAYPYGIGAHANSRLEVSLGKEFSRFTTSIGLQEAAAQAPGKVVFRVYGDAKLLYESKPLGPGQAPSPIDLAVKDIDVLELVAVSQDDNRNTSPPVIAWADAKLR